MTEAIRDFDDRAFRDATYACNDLLSKPLDAWHLLPAPRRTEHRLQALLLSVYDLAAAGFKVEISQDERGWTVRAELRFGRGLHAKAVGTAKDPVAALSQLASHLPRAIEGIERKARKRHDAQQRQAEADAIAEMIA